MKDLFLPEEGKMITTYDAAVVRDEASFVREFGNRNGFSNERSVRHIGCIPLSEYQKMEIEAREHGDVLSASTLKKYLMAHPEFRCVRRLDSGWRGQVR